MQQTSWGEAIGGFVLGTMAAFLFMAVLFPRPSYESNWKCLTHYISLPNRPDASRFAWPRDRLEECGFAVDGEGLVMVRLLRVP